MSPDTKKYRTKDSIQLIEYAFQNYETIPIEEAITETFAYWKAQNEKRIMITKGLQEYPELMLEKIPYKIYPLKKDKRIR